MEIVLDFVALFIVYFAVFFGKWRKKDKSVLLVNTLMYVYLAFVLYFTLMPIIVKLPDMVNSWTSHHYGRAMNFEPFIDVAMGRGDYLRQIILNIIMTVPFGVLLPLTSIRKTNLVKVIFYTFLLSLSIEILQLIMVTSGRMADITDVITNVIGGVVGYIIYLMGRLVIMRGLRKVRGMSENLNGNLY